MSLNVNLRWFLASLSQRVQPEHLCLSFISSPSRDRWSSRSAGGPSDPAGVPASSAARSGPQRQQTSTNERTRSLLSLTEAVCVGQGEFDGGRQLSDDICIEHEMCKDVALRHEVGVHVHIPL